MSTTPSPDPLTAIEQARKQLESVSKTAGELLSDLPTIQAKVAEQLRFVDALRKAGVFDDLAKEQEQMLKIAAEFQDLYHKWWPHGLGPSEGQS